MQAEEPQVLAVDQQQPVARADFVSPPVKQCLGRRQMHAAAGPQRPTPARRPDHLDQETARGHLAATSGHMECRRCDRAGSYRKAGLARFGADIALPDLHLALATCERRADFSRPCGARFTDLR
jgi:hypothetical protein